MGEDFFLTALLTDVFRDVIRQIIIFPQKSKLNEPNNCDNGPWKGAQFRLCSSALRIMITWVLTAEQNKVKVVQASKKKKKAYSICSTVHDYLSASMANRCEYKFQFEKSHPQICFHFVICFPQWNIHKIPEHTSNLKESFHLHISSL